MLPGASEWRASAQESMSLASTPSGKGVPDSSTYQRSWQRSRLLAAIVFGERPLRAQSAT